MSIRPDNTMITTREMMVELVLAPFRAFGHLIESLAESNARVQSLRAISEMSDAELEAKGYTRADYVAMMFRHDA